MYMRILSAAAVGLVLCSHSATADPAGAWTGEATIYGWLPVINGAQQGPDGEPALDLKMEDVLSRLDMAFMGTLEIRPDTRWGFLLDAVYVDLSHDSRWLQDRITLSTSTTVKMLTFAAAYRWHDDGQRRADVYAGVRYFDATLDFGAAAAGPGRNGSTDLSWANGIVGLRGELALNDRWMLRGYADVGGFNGSSDLSWQIYAGLIYSFNESWQATLGYRYLSILKQAGDRAKLDIDLQGPVLGVTYRF